MNRNSIIAAQAGPQGYAPEQQAPLQVDESVETLRVRCDHLIDVVAILVRRLEPVTGDLLEGNGECTPVPSKVPLAISLDCVADQMSVAIRRIEATTRALQI